jgi:hypothetical protein
MTSTSLALILVAATLTNDWSDYSAAYNRAAGEQRELLVLITADWCGACRKLQQEVLPDPRLRPYLAPYVRTIVNVDREPQLTEALGGRGGIPLLIAYSQTPRGWVRRELRGYQTVEKLSRFLDTPQLAAETRTRALAGRAVRAASTSARVARAEPDSLPKKTRPSVVQLLGILPAD